MIGSLLRILARRAPSGFRPKGAAKLPPTMARPSYPCHLSGLLAAVLSSGCSRQLA